MKLYLNELAPWERRKEYYQHIQLGKDVNKQTELLGSAINNQIEAQLRSANALIASQELIREKIGELSQSTSAGFNMVADGISSLQSAFEFGISEVVWQIEQNREVLKNILEVLMAPLDTQAKERRKRAENAFSNGWIEDAEEEFLETEKLNKYDFAIHISLGMIYLFNKINKKKALEYFEKAIKYAKPESNYYTSFALLHKASIMRDLAKIEEAEKCTQEAINLSPDLSEAYYQNAQYNALLNKPDKSISSLKKAIKMDKLYCLKVNTNEDFDSIRDMVNNLFRELRDEEGNKLQSEFVTIIKRQDDFGTLCNKINKFAINPDFHHNLTTNMIKKIKAYIKRNSYFDIVRSSELIIDLKHKQEEMFDWLRSELSKKEDDIKKQSRLIYANKDSEKNLFLNKIKKLHFISIWLIPPITFLVKFIPMLLSEPNKYDFSAVFIPLIPVVGYIIILVENLVVQFIIASVIIHGGLWLLSNSFPSKFDREAAIEDGQNQENLNQTVLLKNELKKLTVN